MEPESESLVRKATLLQGAATLRTRYHTIRLAWEKLSRGVSHFFRERSRLIVSRTLSGLFLVGAANRPRKRKSTNRENPRRVPGQIGKIPKKSEKSQKGQKRTKIGNGRNTVSRVLLRRRELSEFCGKLGEFCEKLGEFAMAHK